MLRTGSRTEIHRGVDVPTGMINLGPSRLGIIALRFRGDCGGRGGGVWAIDQNASPHDRKDGEHQPPCDLDSISHGCNELNDTAR